MTNRITIGGATLSPQAVAELMQVYAEGQRAKQQGISLTHHIPAPHPKQAEIRDHPAQFKVVACGRQVGKTHLGGQEAGDGLVNQQRVLLSSTSQDQSDIFWEYMTTWFAEPIQDGLIYKNEGRRILKYRDGLVRVKTGRDPDILRGGHWDKIIFDECAWLHPDAWNKVGLPMLATTNGTALFLSSPKRRNWFWELYNKAVADTTGAWAAWNFSTHENPFVTQAALDILTANMTEDDYKQEILAMFLEGEGSVFRRIDEQATLQPRAPYSGRFIFGVDFAQVKDYTVVTVMDAESRELVAYDRFNGVSWSLQRGRLRALYDLWKPTYIYAESNSVGGPNIEALQNEGLPVRPFETTASSKPPLIENLVLAFERGEIFILNDEIIKNELKAYERKVSTTTGRSQYSAPEGLHDDCVMALALSWYGCLSGHIRLPVFMD